MKRITMSAIALLITLCMLLPLLPTLSAFAEETEDTTAPAMVGDVYADGAITAKDAIYLLQYLANMVTIPEEHLFAANTFVADDRDDGVPYINTKDAILLLQYLAKMDVTLGAPAEEDTPTSPTVSDEEIAGAVTEILNNGIHLGATYDVGITAGTRSLYTLEGTDGFICLNEDGLLEVIGIKGRSDYLTLKRGDTEIVKAFYTVENSLLCTNIKLALIEKILIQSRSDDVPHSMLAEITEMDLSGILINDPDSAFGIKYLTNLTHLDLSNNYLEDASFIQGFAHLTHLNLENNLIRSVDYVLESRELQRLDVSGNYISDISNLRHMNMIRYLDLSDNEITDISPLSTIYALEALHVSNNNLTVFRDPLSGLENLRELGVGYCNITFSDIISLRYLNNLTYLDISGTDPSLGAVAALTNLTTLIVDDCRLHSKDVTMLNALTNLKFLSIANNRLSAETYGTGLSPESLPSLETLRIGGNSFIDVPDLSAFTTLKTLDLTYSYNLLTLDSLSALPIETLILDHCTSLGIEDNSAGFMDSINALPALKNLSIVSGFNFITRDIYNELQNKVYAGNFSLRFLTDKWVDNMTISNYSKALYFSVDELILDSVLESDGSYTVNYNNPARQIVLSLLNDPTALSTAYTFNIPAGIFRMDIYGSKFAEHVYNFKININERRETEIELNLFDFKTRVTTGNAITAPVGSKLIVNAMLGTNEITATTATNAYSGCGISAYDVILNAASECGATLSVNGGTGTRGANGVTSDESWEAESKTGKRGGDGAHAIVAHNVLLESAGITVIGGSGGAGGKGGGGVAKFSITILKNGSNGGKGGNGGSGGSAIHCSGTVTNPHGNTLSAGSGGAPGEGGDPANKFSHTKGPGNPGSTPDPITTYTP